jgi:hypothetical protein
LLGYEFDIHEDTAYPDIGCPLGPLHALVVLQGEYQQWRIREPVSHRTGGPRPGGNAQVTTRHCCRYLRGLNIIRINPLNNNATIVAGLGAGWVDTTAVFDVNTGQTRSRPLVAHGAGDISGASNGDIFVSAVAQTGEHYIVRVRGGQMTALAFSAHVPSNQTAGPMFLSVDRFGTLFTGFFTSANQTSPRIFLVEPGSLFLSQPVSGSLLSTGARGSSIDDAGILFIADAGNQELIIFNTLTNRVEDIVTIGPIQGIAQPAPRDVAVSPDGSVLVTVSDLFATADNPGVVLKYGRRLRTR